MKAELFTFADEREWSTPRLEYQFTELQKQEAAGYLSEPRKQSIRLVMANIAFEGLMRQRETNEREVEVGQLELNYSAGQS